MLITPLNAAMPIIRRALSRSLSVTGSSVAAAGGTGDTDHFLARMRPSPIPVDIIAGTKNRHKCRGCRGTPVGLADFAKRLTAMIGAQEPSIVIDSSAYNLSSARIGPRIG